MIKIGIVGLGYIGLPLAVEFGYKFKVLGYDKSKERIDELKKNLDVLGEISSKKIQNSKKLEFTFNPKDLIDCNYIIIAVPTPIFKNKLPNLNYLKKAILNLKDVIKKNDIIILESTVYPGVTEEFCAPLIEKITNLKFNEDFFMGYCPERINPGDKKYTIENINKIVSGSNLLTKKKIEKIYKKIIKAKVIATNTIKVAESAKVIENAQRDINIAFINEIAKIFNKLNIDTNEVLEAASSKWNFINFKPGLVGGHCISVDPYYLSYISKKNNIEPKIIDKGREINDSMPLFIVKNLKKQIKLNFKKKLIKILILGITFKENCSDIRNSKSIDICDLLVKQNFKVEIYDPYFGGKIKNKNFKIIKKPKKNFYDVILITVPHDYFYSLGYKNIKSFGKKNLLFFDIKSMFKKEFSNFRL
ncbi:MAG: Vi polysaccharide biosynthesis protein VipA/TviB [Rickettsiales bacterium]|nr:Vi polysaccharide biosynthesis protein VipA/TviB [Rickettsiales bacterium]|tara:strand:- start:586 stop:1839 length:1254 start_codon:yes stop_codon:yes gene_type:complete